MKRHYYLAVGKQGICTAILPFNNEREALEYEKWLNEYGVAETLYIGRTR